MVLVILPNKELDRDFEPKNLCVRSFQAFGRYQGHTQNCFVIPKFFLFQDQKREFTETWKNVKNPKK